MHSRVADLILDSLSMLPTRAKSLNSLYRFTREDLFRVRDEIPAKQRALKKKKISPQSFFKCALYFFKLVLLFCVCLFCPAFSPYQIVPIFFHWYCDFLGAFAKLLKTTVSFVMSVHPSAWNSSAPIEQIFTKFDIWVCRENFSFF